MKVLALYLKLILGEFMSDDGPIVHLCNSCDLYDMNTQTIFDKLEIPLLGPRGNGTDSPPKMSFNIEISNDFTLTKQKSKNLIPSLKIEHTIIIFTVASVIIGLLNLIATVTVLITERRIATSARKTYMQTAIIDNE